MGKLRNFGSEVGGFIDGAVLRALRHRFNRLPGRKSGIATSADELFRDGGSENDRRAALLETIFHYERADVRASFYTAPPHPDVTLKTEDRLDDGQVIDAAWPSLYEPSLPEMREVITAWEHNRGARARLFLHDTPAKTAIVCLHGYQGGSFFVEERAFQARWLYELGADVALFTMPFHGARRERDAPSWPSPNPVRTVEGFGQAIFDLRALVRFLRARPGAAEQRIAAVGMSLGGYTAALWATIDALDFLAPIIPVASWAELLWAHGEGRAERARAERDGVTLELLQRAMSLVSPLDRAPLVAPDHVLVQSARGDRIAPPEHAERLAKHFGGVHLAFTGGHVLQLGRRDAFVALAQRLALVGLIPKR